MDSIDRESDSSLHAQLLEIMHTYIAESSPGRRLPSENALCKKYKIARMTAGRVMNRLESEGKIIRRRGSGSFVAARPVFTFCLPCEDFLSHTNSATHYTRLMMKGAIRAAREYNIGFETVAVSPTNNMADIDVSCLNHINRSSRVMLTPWFCHLFELLVARRAQVCLLHAQDIPYGYRQYTREWLKIERNRRAAVCRIIDWLRQRGCRRIALIARYVVSEKNHPVFVAYREAMLRDDCPEIVYELASGSFAPVDELKLFYREHRYDGVILGGGILNWAGGIHQLLGCPQETPVFGMDYPAEIYPQTDPIPYCAFPFERAGYDAVKLLMDERNRGVAEIYDYEFFEELKSQRGQVDNE